MVQSRYEQSVNPVPEKGVALACTESSELDGVQASQTTASEASRLRPLAQVPEKGVEPLT